MRTRGGTTAPFGHVMPVAFPRAAAPSVSPSRRRAANPLLPHVALKSPTISMLPAPLARTDWPTAANAADHSLQYWGSGARVCTRRRATGPPGDHKVASIMYGVVVPSQATVRTWQPVRRSLEAIRKPVAPIAGAAQR